MTRIIPIEPSIPREPKEPDNTQRAKSTRQYPESQKRQTIPGEPKAPDNTRRAKSTRQYPESQKCQTIPGEPKAPDNTRRAKSTRQYPESQKCQTIPREPITFFLKIALKMKKWQVLLSLHKMFLDNNWIFFQIMTRIIPIEPSIPGEPKVPDNTRRAKSARQYPESQKHQTIPGEPKVPDNTRIGNYFFSQNCFENEKVASITQFT